MATKKTAVKSPHSLDHARKLKESLSKDFDVYKRINQDLEVAEWILAGRPDLEKPLGYSGNQKYPIGYNVGIILMDRVIRLLDHDTEENNKKISNVFFFLSELPDDVQYFVVKGTITMEVVNYRKHLLRIPYVMKVYNNLRRVGRREKGYYLPKEAELNESEILAFQSLVEKGPDGLETSHIKSIYDWATRYVDTRVPLADHED